MLIISKIQFLYLKRVTFKQGILLRYQLILVHYYDCIEIDLNLIIFCFYCDAL